MNEDELDQDELLGLIDDERNDDFWNDEQVDAVEIVINEQIDEPFVESVPKINQQQIPIEPQAEHSKKLIEKVETASESSKENDSKLDVINSEQVSHKDRAIDQQKPLKAENLIKSQNGSNQTSRSLNKNKFAQPSGQHANKSQFDAASNKRNENNKVRNVSANQTLPLPNPKPFNQIEHGATTAQMRKSFPSATLTTVSSSPSVNQSLANISTISSSSALLSNSNQPFLFNGLSTNGASMNPPNGALMPTPPPFNHPATFQAHYQQTQLAPISQYSMMNSMAPIGLVQPNQGLLGNPPQPFMHNQVQASRDFLQPQYNPYSMNSISSGNNGGVFLNNQAVMANNLISQPLINNSSPISNGNKHLSENYMSSASASFQYSSTNGSNGMNANMMMINPQQQQTTPVISQINSNQLKPNTIYINPSFSKKNSFDTAHQQEQRTSEKQSSISLPLEKRDDEMAKKKPKKDRKELELLLEKRLAAELAEEKTHENENISLAKSSSYLHSVSSKRKSDQSRNDQRSNDRSREPERANDLKNKKYQKDERRDEQDEVKRKRLSQTPISKPVGTSLSKANESKPTKESSHKPIETQRKDQEVKEDKKDTKFESLFVDDEYARKLEEQKRKREQILREKEEKRNQRISELKMGQKDTSNTNTDTNLTLQRKIELKEQPKQVEPKKIVKLSGNRQSHK
jgi:hypothetical protein